MKKIFFLIIVDKIMQHNMLVSFVAILLLISLSIVQCTVDAARLCFRNENECIYYYKYNLYMQ